MIDERFVFLAAALVIFGDLTYFVEVIKGKIKPNKVTWFFWALAPLIGLWAQLTQGVGIPALITFAYGAVPLLVFVASFMNKNAYWKIGIFDLICGALALLGLVLWQITGEGNIAIFFALLADAFGAFPTIVKAWKAPETEGFWIWLFNIAASLIVLLSLKQWSFSYYAFPVYIALLGVVFVLLVKFKLGKRFLV